MACPVCNDDPSSVRLRPEFLGSLKRYVRNKAHPEGSIAEGYVANECLTFLSLYLDGVETRFNKPDRNNDKQETHGGLSIFSYKFVHLVLGNMKN
nr:uncharacterized protein LOC109169448 [Ipomoea batatas]GMC91093.1 uncharacterized protein LOC109169448 [Ipomoea batatas]